MISTPAASRVSAVGSVAANNERRRSFVTFPQVTQSRRGGAVDRWPTAVHCRQEHDHSCISRERRATVPRTLGSSGANLKNSNWLDAWKAPDLAGPFEVVAFRTQGFEVGASDGFGGVLVGIGTPGDMRPGTAVRKGCTSDMSATESPRVARRLNRLHRCVLRSFQGHGRQVLRNPD